MRVTLKAVSGEGGKISEIGGFERAGAMRPLKGGIPSGFLRVIAGRATAPKNERTPHPGNERNFELVSAGEVTSGFLMEPLWTRRRCGLKVENCQLSPPVLGIALGMTDNLAKCRRYHVLIFK